MRATHSSRPMAGKRWHKKSSSVAQSPTGKRTRDALTPECMGKVCGTSMFNQTLL